MIAEKRYFLFAFFLFVVFSIVYYGNFCFMAAQHDLQLLMTHKKIRYILCWFCCMLKLYLFFSAPFCPTGCLLVLLSVLLKSASSAFVAAWPLAIPSFSFFLVIMFRKCPGTPAVICGTTFSSLSLVTAF